MAKAFKYVLVVLFFLAAFGVCLYYINSTYDKKVTSSYYDEIGSLYASVPKDQGLALQQISASKDDNLFIFGSSELGSIQKPFHPAYFFAGKRDGFQVNLIGRGFSQSLIHAINIGALGESLRGRKAVIIISPQWFTEEGPNLEGFNANFSELQFLAFMQNAGIDNSIKIKAAGRVENLLGRSGMYESAEIYSKLYAGNNILSKGALSLASPYYSLDYYFLSVKDKINAVKELENSRGNAVMSGEKTAIDWQKEISDADDAGKAAANNNDFLIENSYYDMYIRDKLDSLKGSMKGASYTNSPEYEDFGILLDVCKSEGIKPLIISVPVNGRWYDYCGFDKEKRQEYYKKINQIAASYGFDTADFSGYEYEDYFLKDIMHLGWKGWVYVDEAISSYYHKD